MLGREVARDLKRQCMQVFVVSISAKILILFYQILRGNCLLAQYSNVLDHGRCIALYQILEISDDITDGK